MAETYGTETHEHEDEYGDEHQHEHDAVNEAPSDYEFSDDSGATADVEHNEEILSTEEKSPRRSPVLPIIAVLGGVIILGGVAWWQFGNHPSASSPFPGSTPVPIATVPPPPVTAEHKVSAPPLKIAANTQVPTLPVTPRVASASPQMEITDQSSAAALPSGIVPANNTAPTAAGGIPAPSAPAAQPFAIPDVTPAHPEAVPVTPAPVVVSPAPVVPVKSASAVPAAMPERNPVAVATPPAASPTLTDKAQIEALNQHINELQSKLDHVNQQLNQVMNMVAATVNTGHASAAAQEQSNKVAAELAALHKMPSRNMHPPHTVAAANEATPPEATPSQEGIAMEPPPPTHHTARHRKTHQSTPHKSTQEAEAQVPSSHPSWVLRAATPGHAWVATSADSHDLKAVQVGDLVAGIGEVTAIRQQGTSWVVQGTHGTIH